MIKSNAKNRVLQMVLAAGVAGMLMALAGCGSGLTGAPSGSSGSGSAMSAANGNDQAVSISAGSGNQRSKSNQAARTVGMDNCAQCHNAETLNWVGSAHGNEDAIDHNTHAELDLGLDSDGFPYYGYFSDSTCKSCHDPLRDGQHLIPDYTAMCRGR